MELNHFQVIKGPVVTEKLTTLQDLHNTYGFRVDMRANKVQIRQAVEKIWDVKVESVRTHVRKGKPSRVRFQRCHQADTKIAIVKLAEGQRIES